MQIVEVSPRDGLQNQPQPVTTDQKLQLIERLVTSGVRRIEATSFVSPRRVPQMADAADVMARVPRTDGVRYSALVANARGAERAVDAGVDEINAVVLSTDEFGRRNQGADRPAMVATYREIATIARAAGVQVAVTVGASFGCPFEGEVAVESVADLTAMLLDAPPDEICLADTIGVGVPTQVRALAAAVGAVAPGIDLRFHFHNTRNTGYANAVAALEAGAAALDASLGGIGGCPFAPRATGNIATEDLLYLLDRSGVPTTIDRHRLTEDARWMAEALGLDAPSLLPRAGDFPPQEVPSA